MKHYLVTGGAGFIGNHLVRSLLQSDPLSKVTCIDNFDTFYPRSIKEFNIRDLRENERFRLIEADIVSIDAKTLAAKFTGDKPDCIIHIAAKAGVRPSIEHPELYQRTNVLGLQHLLDFAKETGCQQFVFASSSSVYGVNEHFPWSENEQLMPISPYAMTKLAGEMLGHVYSRLYDIRFIALRFFTVYGPAQRPDLAIHKFMRAIMNGSPISVYGDGNTSRDYTYVADIVAGITAAITYDASRFEIINLGNNYSIPLHELIHSIEQVAGQKAIINHLPEQPGDVPKTFAAIEKAKQLLGYHPLTTLPEGLKSFHQWLLRAMEAGVIS